MDTYNDKYKNIQPEEHSKNIKLILDKLVERVDNVVFSNSIARFNERANLENKKYMESADVVTKRYRDKIQILDLFSIFSILDLDKFFTFKYTKDDADANAGINAGDIDFGHPNILGNAHIAKIFLKEIFEIEFNAELYIKETLEGKKYPGY